MKTQDGTVKKPRATTAKSGYWAAKAALVRFGSNAFDGRTRIAKALDEFRDELVADLGGAAAISKQQQVLITLATRTHFLLESLDAYIFSMPSPVNKRARALYPVIRERQSLADSLAKQLVMLGLERKLPPEKPLSQFLAERAARPAAPRETTDAEAETGPGDAIDEETTQERSE